MKGGTENGRMSSFPAQPKVFCSSRITKAVQRVLLAVSVTVCSSAFAHATLVLGTLTATPSPVQADAPFVLTLTLLDLTQIPVEDARVLAEFRRPGMNQPLAVRFQESDAPGVYQVRLALPRTGRDLIRCSCAARRTAGRKRRRPSPSQSGVLPASRSSSSFRQPRREPASGPGLAF